MFGQFDSYGSIVNHVETAVSEVAYEDFAFEEFADKIREARKRGVRDVRGWLADELYNDSDLVCDLVGDALYEFVSNQGDDPNKAEDWNKHVDQMQTRLRHVSLDRLRM